MTLTNKFQRTSPQRAFTLALLSTHRPQAIASSFWITKSAADKAAAYSICTKQGRQGFIWLAAAQRRRRCNRGRADGQRPPPKGRSFRMPPPLHSSGGIGVAAVNQLHAQLLPRLPRVPLGGAPFTAYQPLQLRGNL